MIPTHFYTYMQNGTLLLLAVNKKINRKSPSRKSLRNLGSLELQLGLAFGFTPIRLAVLLRWQVGIRRSARVRIGWTLQEQGKPRTFAITEKWKPQEIAHYLQCKHSLASHNTHQSQQSIQEKYMKNKLINHLKLFWILENGQKFITMKKWHKKHTGM